MDSIRLVVRLKREAMKTLRKLLKALYSQGMHRQICCYENALIECGGDAHVLGQLLKKHLR